MEVACTQFVEELIKTSDLLQNELKDTYDDWLPDAPPVIIIFAALGHAIAHHFDQIDSKEFLFQQIESAMISENQLLKTAVATGLLEALVAETGQTNTLWQQIEKLLGKYSKAHARCWLGIN